MRTGGNRYVDNKTKFACSLFDINNNKGSYSLITGLKQKINPEELTLSPVVNAVNQKYDLLRTETAINDNATIIGIHWKTNEESAVSLQSLWLKNIQYNKKQ